MLQKNLVWLICMAASVAAHGQDGPPKAAKSIGLDSYYKLFQKDLKVSTASKFEVRADAAPAVISVIPRAVLLSRGYRTLGEALASAPGLFVLDDLVTANVSVRGINLGVDSWSRGLKFLVNGMPVTYEATGGGLTGAEFIPVNIIESIEIIRGPASALYGANAFLGVVNVVTMRPDHDVHSEATAEGGVIRNHGAYHGGGFLHLGSSDHRAYFLAAASAGNEDRSGLRLNGHAPTRLQGVSSENDLSRPMSAFSRGVVEMGELGQLSLQLTYQQLDSYNEFGDVGTLTHQTRLAWSNTTARIEHRIGFANNLLELHTFVGGMRGIELPLQRLDIGVPSYILIRERQNVGITGGTELALKIDKYSGLIGVDVLSETHLGDTVFQQQRQSITQTYGDRELINGAASFYFNDVAVYAQASASPFDALGLWGGLRYDNYSRWQGNLSWRAAATYAAREDLHFKLLYGTSFVPPSPTQLTGTLLGPNGVQGNLALQPQNAQTLEASGAWVLNDLLSIQFNGFWTRVTKRVEYVAQFRGQTAQNSFESDTFGAEASAEAQQGLFTGSANVSYSYTTVYGDPLTSPSWFNYVYGDGRVDKALMPGFPAWMGHLTAGVQLPDYFVQATVGLNMIGARGASVANAKLAQASYSLPGYVTLDAHVRSLNVHVGDHVQCELSIHGTNLLGQSYDEPGDLGADIPSRGRSIYAKARFTL